MRGKSINIPCESCTYADAYGRDCKFGLMYPIGLLIAGVDRCPNRRPKTQEQIDRQLKAKQK